MKLVVLQKKYINCNDHVNILEHPVNMDDNIVTVFGNNYEDETFKIDLNPYPFFGYVSL